MGSGFLAPVESDRPATIQPVDLGQGGIAYVKNALEQGGPLSSLVAGMFDGKGASFAPLEKGMDLKRALQFETGAFMPTAAIRKWIANYIESQWGTNSQLIFADPWMKVDDFKHPPEQPYFLGGETPYYAPAGNDLFAALTAGAKAPVTWYFPVFVVNPPVPLPSPGTRADADAIAMLARNTQAVLASAYDHEGYVVWQK